MTNIELIKIFIVIYLDNTIKYIILTILQQNVLRISLDKKQKKIAIKKTNRLKIIKKVQKLLKNTNIAIELFSKKIYIIWIYYLYSISKLNNITVKYWQQI